MTNSTTSFTTPGIQILAIGTSGTYDIVIDMHPEGAVYWRTPAVAAVAQVKRGTRACAR